MRSAKLKHTIASRDNHHYSCPILRNTDCFRVVFAPFINKASAKGKESVHVADVGILKVFRACLVLKNHAEENRTFTIYGVAREVGLSSGRYNEGLLKIFWTNLESGNLIEKIRRRGGGWVYKFTSEGRACFLALFAVKKGETGEKRDDECLL